VLLSAIQVLGLHLGAGAQQRCEFGRYPPSAPTERYSLQDDGTAVDTQARLMWMRCSIGQTWSGGDCVGTPRQLDWRAAQQAAQDLNRSGSQFYNDWRLPQIRELALIAERQCDNPRINLLVFPQTPAAFYWTATARPGDASGAAAMALSFGPQGLQAADKATPFQVRLVRNAE
jgi:hypothetical protein